MRAPRFQVIENIADSAMTNAPYQNRAAHRDPLGLWQNSVPNMPITRLARCSKSAILHMPATPNDSST